ncbi:hypothetical protein ETB97_004251 [Aspergillus alliaceus]|uniref:Uncharacterized protein n=1 Tax=Petromyces alliaceus TaxID=209559 RepID=A0A8H6A0D0_PETAA|nr:hypothetical protein ETB97_004251 [Aspergillus burnettii]
MQMASAQLEKPSRPETDYERWLRDHDENYRPGDRPLYGPGVKGTEDATENVKWKDRLSDGKKNYSAIYGIILQSKHIENGATEGEIFHFPGKIGTNEELWVIQAGPFATMTVELNSHSDLTASCDTKMRRSFD